MIAALLPADCQLTKIIQILKNFLHPMEKIIITNRSDIPHLLLDTIMQQNLQNIVILLLNLIKISSSVSPHT